MRYVLVCFAILSLVLFVACGSSGTQTPPSCMGSTCTCPSGQTCDITSSNCGPNSCTLDCENNVDCTGSCGSSCSLKCAGGATCDMTLGPSGSVNCSGSSTCHIQCTGSCTLSCETGSTCDLKCAGDSAPKSVTASATCQ